MKKTLFLLIALLSLPLLAEQRSSADAEAVANNYLQSNATRHLLGVNPKTPELSLALIALSPEKKADYYVFNNGKGQGYVIVSGDDQAAPVLGYSDTGSFDVNDIPDGLKYWLDYYASEMGYLRSHPQAGYVAPRSELTTSVKPLLSTTWNQSAPYNDLCPTYSGGCAVTGCVATAAAQIVNYYKWPAQGIGSHSYECNVNKEETQTLSANFEVSYDWDNMLDDYSGSYNTTQADAVATLMYHLGVASEMNYGSSSGTQTYSMMEALRTYFGYNKGMKLHKRGNTPIAQWDSLLINELDNSHPVMFSGFAPNGGHCFVFDGYNADGYYHINWGWGGKSNGYFLVTALNPTDQGIGSFEGGYNSGQEFVTGFYPDDGSPEPDAYAEFTCEDYATTVDQVNLGEEAPIVLNRVGVNGYGYGSVVTVYFGFYLSDANGNQADFRGENLWAYNLKMGATYSFTGDYTLSYTPSTSLTDGDYKLWLVYKLPDSDMEGYVFYDHSSTSPGYINAHVENGVMYFSKPATPDGELSLTDLTAPAQVGTNSTFEVRATIANSGEEYYDNVYFALMQQGEIDYLFDGLKIDVATGNDVIVKSSLTAPSSPGNYELAVLDKNYNVIGEAIDVQVLNSSNYNLSIATNLQVPSYYMEAENISATAVISNTGSGAYVGSIPFMIINNEVSRVLGTGNSSTVTIPAGGSASVNIKTSFGGVPGTVYKICLRDPSYPNSYRVWGNMIDFEIMAPKPSLTLDRLLEEGTPGEEYNVGDNLTIVDAHTPSIFVSNGKGSWIEVKCGGNFDMLNAMDAFKAGTVYGTYSVTNGNPSLTLTQLPEAGVAQDIVVEKINMSEPFAPAPAQVIEFTGYYFPENGVPVMRAYDGSGGVKGQSVELSLDWLSAMPSLVEGKRYTIHGVAQLKQALNAAPRLMEEGNDLSFQNYIVYPTQAPTIITGIDKMVIDGVKLNVAGGTITIDGAHDVAVYNTAGALVSNSAVSHLPAGVYIVVADGKRHKVVIK